VPLWGPHRDGGLLASSQVGSAGLVQRHYALWVRSFATSAIPAFAEQLGQAWIVPYSSANTRANLSDTCAPQWLHSGIVSLPASSRRQEYVILLHKYNVYLPG